MVFSMNISPGFLFEQNTSLDVFILIALESTILFTLFFAYLDFDVGIMALIQFAAVFISLVL